LIFIAQNLNLPLSLVAQESSFLSEDGESNSDKNFGANVSFVSNVALENHFKGFFFIQKGLKSNQGSLKYQTDDQYGTDADKKRKAKRPVWK